MSWTVTVGDVRRGLDLPDDSIDAVVCDPPYELGFMARAWDASGVAYSVAVWRDVLRVLKPGGHLLAFGGTRTYHRMACAIEDAGFEIRDSIDWIYGVGFPKSLDVSKAIEAKLLTGGSSPKHLADAVDATGQGIPSNDGVGLKWANDGTRQGIKRHEAGGWAPTVPEAVAWQGWGTALKPAHEPIVVARKPLIGTVAANVLAYGTGGLNVDGCRVATSEDLNGGAYCGNGNRNTIFGLGNSGKRLFLRWAASLPTSYSLTRPGAQTRHAWTGVPCGRWGSRAG
jgi:site-specific DNA-methyltransferase (adenine-specific)